MAAENTLHERSAMLHSLFELADGVSETEFRQAFEAFFGHLKAKGFAKCFRIMRRKHLEGFDAKLPTLEYYAAIEFHNLDRRATIMWPRTPNLFGRCIML